MANNKVTSMTTYTGKQSEFKDLVMAKLYVFQLYLLHTQENLWTIKLL